jgi:hypothetical protein
VERSSLGGFAEDHTKSNTDDHHVFSKEKNSENTTKDEVHFWRIARCGSHLLLRFVERTSEGEEDE